MTFTIIGTLPKIMKEDKQMKGLVYITFMFFIIAFLEGCGGGNGGSNVLTVSGVAAVGTPLTGTVTLKDSSSTPKELSTSLAKDGSFSLNVTGLAAPFLLQATGTAGGNNYTLYSLSSTGGNCNINPLTHLAVTMAHGGADLSEVFFAPAPAKIAAISKALPVAVASIHDKLAPMLNQIGAPPVNIMTDRIAANGQGADLLFDLVSITVRDGSVSIVNKADGGTILPSTSVTAGILTDSPNVNVMSSVFTITGRCAGGNVSARSKASPYPSTPLMTVKADAEGNYKLIVPNGTYEVCGFGAASFNCLNIAVSNANVTATDFPPAEQVTFQEVEYGRVGYSQITWGLHVLRSAEEWANFWSTLKGSIVQQPPLPSVNFDENIVIAVIGIFSSGGHSIKITDIQKLATDGVVVHAVYSSPGPGCGVTAAFEQITHIVATPVFPGEATLNRTEKVGAACQ